MGASVTIGAGKYFLVKLGGGTAGATLPAPDLSSTINMSATAGKVALVRNGTALSGSCPTSTQIADLMTFGTTLTNICNTSTATAGGGTNVNSSKRKELCVSPSFDDTNVDGTDFISTVTAANPRNSGSIAVSCSCTGP